MNLQPVLQSKQLHLRILITMKTFQLTITQRNKKLNRLILRSILAVFLILNSSCIHTTSHETKRLNLQNENSFRSSITSPNGLQVKSVIYSQEKFPLDDFFERLLKGEFKKSFQKLSLTYEPSNTKNEVMQKLLSSGLTPVYVSIMNTGSTDRHISYEQFSLHDGASHKIALHPNQLPTEIKQFSPAAVAANVYNITVVVTLTVMFAILLAHAQTQAFIPDSGNSDSSLSDENDVVLNKTTKTTYLDYKSYLITERKLKPGEQINGLVFFDRDTPLDTDRALLRFSETALSQP